MNVFLQRNRERAKATYFLLILSSVFYLHKMYHTSVFSLSWKGFKYADCIPCRDILLYSHLHHHSASQRHNNNKDRRTQKDAWRKAQEDFFRKIFTSHFICKVWKGCSRFACERVLETEHKLHILTPLLRPSRCVFLVLLMLGSTPSRLPRTPSVGCGLPYHIWSPLSRSLLATALAPQTKLS